MYAVGRLGSYITRGVYSVSNPFHPFSGAIDIIVVEQQNGSLKSSPWYVQFGKFQGVLKSKENAVSLNVNGVDADFSMYLDNKGEAYFIREVFGQEDTSDLNLSSLRDSTDGKGSISPRFVKTRSCNYDSGRERLVSQIEQGEGEILSRNRTSGPKAFGLVFRSSSALETGMYHQECTFQEDREGSLERAEIAANLLEVRWSTNLPPSKSKKGNTRRVADLDLPNGAQDQLCSHVENNTQGKTICDHDKAETRLSNGPDNHIEAFTLQEAYLDANLASDSSRSSSQTHSFGSNLTNGSEDSDKGTVQKMSKLNPDVLHSMEGNGASIGDKSGNTVNILDSAHGSRPERAHSFTSYDTSDSLNESGSMGSDGGPCQELCSACSACEEVDGTALIIGNSMEMRCCVGSKLPPRIPECKIDRNVGSIEPRILNEHLTKTDDSTGKNSSLNEAPSVIASDNEFHRDTAAEDTIAHFRGQELDTVGISGSCEERVNESGDILDDSNLATDNLEQDNTSQLKMSMTSSDSTSTAIAHKDIDDQTQTADSLPSLVSNSPLCNSPDSNSGNISLIEDEIPALEMEAAKQLQSELCSAPSEDLLVLDDITGSLDMETEKRHKLASASFKYTQIETEMRKILLEPAAEISLCGHLLNVSMGYEAAAVAFDSEKLDMGKIASLGSDLIKDDRLVVRIGGLYFPWEAALDIVSKIGTDEQILEPKGMITVDHVEKGGEDPQKLLDTKKSKWTLWPFSANKSNTMDGQPSTLVESEKGSVDMPDKTDTCKDEEAPKKKVVKAKTPTSEQLVSLNLKEGKNIVTFTYSTEMLGEQQVDARIFLWKWDARIVISDVDGTITKSDVLGQFMPLMGYDWTQTGVTHLFSAIKENGYELLFLSARAISQACITRQFLINLKQDGKPLPEGPIVISPDGLFPSLFREVIRRAPHEFKIACLEDIKALFPPDTNPFYAGFGNRDTDEVSYLKVGIPKGKIFIINPKGEVAVHRRVDTKSYTSLHTLVHNIFPPPSSVPITEQEDYNTWNFWKLPPPDFRS